MSCQFPVACTLISVETPGNWSWSNEIKSSYDGTMAMLKEDSFGQRRQFHSISNEKQKHCEYSACYSTVNLVVGIQPCQPNFCSSVYYLSLLLFDVFSDLTSWPLCFFINFYQMTVGWFSFDFWSENWFARPFFSSSIIYPWFFIH